MLNLAVSNLAWPPEEAAPAYATLARRGVRGLEIAPGLLFHDAADPFAPTRAELRRALAPVRDAGLALVSMQALLFGVEGAALFGDAEGRRRFTGGLGRAIALAGRLGLPHLVMGSPRQRAIPPGLGADAAETLALRVFGELGDLALAHGTRIGIEPNPAAYGTNFLLDLRQAAAFVERLGHPAVTLTLDLGALRMSGEIADLGALAARHGPRLGHVHLSEPHLAPAPADAGEAARVLATLSGAGYRGWFSVEMKAPPQGALEALSACLRRLERAAATCSEGIAA